MPNPSPELIRRIDALEGCAGSWLLDRRDEDQRGYHLDHLPSYGCRTPAEALAACTEVHWRNLRLLFSPERLDDDARWPGSYSAPTHYRSNARVFRQEFANELMRADGDGPGIALDVRFITAEMIETLHALEDYPVLDEADHSTLELEEQDAAWERWAQSNWLAAVTKALQQYAPETADAYWAEEHLKTVTNLESKLFELFQSCCDQSSTYWEEESDGGFYIDIDRAAACIDRSDLVELTNLPLLHPDQEWRREPYPWPHAEPSPLAPQLT